MSVRIRIDREQFSMIFELASVAHLLRVYVQMRNTVQNR